MAQLTKKDRRLRRATRARAKIREIGTARLTVHRTPRHIYAQITTPDGAACSRPRRPCRKRSRRT